MSLSSAEIYAGPAKDAEHDLVIDRTEWGYIIHEPVPVGRAKSLAAAFGRFGGTILLMAAGGLLLLPEMASAPGLDSMKLAATVMFTVVGLILFLSGRAPRQPEIHVDTDQREIRIGRRGLRGQFRPSANLGFQHVASVYLLRTKDQSRPTRLFLRLAGLDEAIEVAKGTASEMESLREVLARDLVRDPVEAQFDRTTRLAS